MLNRRTFVQKSSWAALGACTAFDSLTTLKHLHKKGNPGLSFDMHCHPRSRNTILDMIKNGLSSGFLALVADLPLLKRTETGIVPEGAFKPGEAWIEFKNQLEAAHQLLDSAGIRPASSYADFDKRQESGEFAPFLACEGGDFLEGSLEFLERAYLLDLRSVQLVHYVPNDLGDLQTAAPLHHGLSAFGKSVVKKMNELGLLIDVAHASLDTVKDVVEVSSEPVMLSHSILKRQPFMPISARALTEEHAQLIAQNGGVIGMWPSGLSSSLEDFVEATFRMIDLVGIDHVGIGTDMDANYKPVITNYGEFFQCAEILSEQGLSKEETEKVTGGNALRILKRVFRS